tara:strand:+ start:969 stop:1190 length:222 start_codon:yes stop_codon:yes gene_type:complete
MDNKCIRCEKKLKPLTLKNKTYKDWEARRLHKKCWIELKSIQDRIFDTYCLDDAARKEALTKFKERAKLVKLL